MVKGAKKIIRLGGVQKDAVSLRQSGLSLGDISKRLMIPKSTVFGWVRSIPFPEKYYGYNWARTIQQKGAERLKELKRDRQREIFEEVEKEVSQICVSSQMEKAVLSMLYWAEGGKTGGTLQFSNTDPRLMKLFVLLLRRNYQIDEKRLRVQLHLHYYHPIRKTRTFWSEILGVPESQFNKIARKPRSRGKRFRKNIGGICALRYNELRLKEKVVQFGYVLGEKIINCSLSSTDRASTSGVVDGCSIHPGSTE